MTSTNPLYAADFHYHDGEHEYTETLYFRAGANRTEEEIRTYLADFSGLDPDQITWTAKSERATATDEFVWDTFGERTVQVSMRPIRSLDDLDVEVLR